MSILPEYHHPDFTQHPLAGSPPVRCEPAPADGVVPGNFHGTSNHPEYIHVGEGVWILTPSSRMDCVLVLRGQRVSAVEARRVIKDDPIVIGRTENGEDGIYVHTEGFAEAEDSTEGKFAFRTRGTRETPFSRSYDDLYRTLRHDRDHGCIVWVLGPAVAFDKDSRNAMEGLIENGYCHALMAGNALATHDLEAAHFNTGLGQDIYTQELQPNGHYHHLDILNEIRRSGSIRKGMAELGLTNGIIHACEKMDVPYLLAGSIRDDGPLPEVISDVYEAQDRMRTFAGTATTVITMATQLHAIAFGNMVPSYRVMPDDSVRPVFFLRSGHDRVQCRQAGQPRLSSGHGHPD